MKIHANRALAGSILLCLALAGCKRSDDQAPESEATTAASATDGAAAPGEAKPGLSANGGRLVLPIVEGRPGVAYFEIANTGSSAATITSAHIAGVEHAEMHRTTGGKMEAAANVEIAPGSNVAFAPGGLHVMAFGVSESLEEGGTTELTLDFADGGSLSIPIVIEAMGSAGSGGAAASAPARDHAGMEGMQH